jgi:hypothetical protein
MRQACAAFLIAVTFSGPLRASEKEAKAVIDRAIKAHGGADALKKAAVFKSAAKGTRHVAGRDVAYTRALEARLPGRLRLAITLGGRVETAVLLDGAKAKQAEGDRTIELKAPRVKELRGEADVLWLATLVPLLGEGVVLSAAKGAKVEGEEAAGVKATRKGHADTTLYFSKKTGLLVRIARRGAVAGKEAEMEWTYGGHKEVAGVKVPTKEVQSVGGKKVAELTISEWSFPAKIDAGRFTKP